MSLVRAVFALQANLPPLDEKRLSPAITLHGAVPLPLSSREVVTFLIVRVFCISNQVHFKPPDKTVILSEALRRSIANRELYGAESKDPGDACWQMLLRAFRPQTTTEDKKVTNSDPSRPPSLVIPTGANPNFLPRRAGHGPRMRLSLRKAA
jgi:hypothetical protein